jgi:hypothetical protein
MKRFLLLTGCAFLSIPAMAQTSIPPSPAYQECTALASNNPAEALVKAEAWLKIDTSIAAQHCRAMALFGLRRFAEAGDALSSVRDGIGADNFSLRSYIARQASRAWMNANQADKALAVLSGQISELGTVRNNNAVTAKLTAELLLDRARLNVSYGKLDDAIKDLDHGVSLAPINEDILMERALAFEKLGDKSLARSDAEIVAKLNDKNTAAQELLTRLGVVAPAAANLSAPVAATPPASPAAATHKRSSVKPQPSTPASQAP